MKIGIFTGIIASMLVMSGCSTSAPKPTWKKVGISQYDTHNTIQKCHYQVGIAKVKSDREESLFNSCMEAEGYRYTSKKLS